jgi:hypothetical protein
LFVEDPSADCFGVFVDFGVYAVVYFYGDGVGESAASKAVGDFVWLAAGVAEVAVDGGVLFHRLRRRFLGGVMWKVAPAESVDIRWS